MLIVLILFPVLVSSTVRIFITPASNTNGASLKLKGSASWPLSRVDQEAFNITNAVIYSKSKTWYKKPYNVLNLNDVHHSTNIKVSAKIINAQIFQHHKSPALINVKSITNRLSESTTFNWTLTADVNEYISSMWEGCPEFGGGKILKLSFGDKKLSYDSALGEHVYRLSAKRTIKPDTDLKTTLHPGEVARVALRATKATLQAKIDYEVMIAGKICVKFYWIYLVPENKCYDVRKYATSNVIRTSQFISVDYYYGAYVEVENDL